MKKRLLISTILIFICINLFSQVSGNALQFDGIDDYLEIQPNSSLRLSTHLTIEMWIKLAEINKDHRLWREGGNWWTVEIHQTGNVEFYFNSLLYSTTYLTDINKWYHVACTYDSSKMIIYIDGIASGEKSFSGIGGNSDGPFFIGFESSASSAFKGLIDEYRIWNVSRTQNQIQSTMNDTLSSAYYSEGSDSGLVAYWRFDEIQGDTTYDLTSNHNDGLINGAVFVPSNALSEVAEYGWERPCTPFLNQNYPNPFNPSTTITYSVQKPSYVSLIIYNINGKEVKTLISEFQNANIYFINFDATQFSSGIYFYKLQIGNDIRETKKMLLVR